MPFLTCMRVSLPFIIPYCATKTAHTSDLEDANADPGSARDLRVMRPLGVVGNGQRGDQGAMSATQVMGRVLGVRVLRWHVAKLTHDGMSFALHFKCSTLTGRHPSNALALN